MDDKSENNIFIIYHWPCFDGIQSLMNLMMIMRTKINLDNWAFQKIFNRLDEYLTSQKDNNQLKMQIAQSQSIIGKYDYQKENSFFNSKICNQFKQLRQITINIYGFRYIPVAYVDDQDEAIRLLKQHPSSSTFNSSILILLDYYGRTINALEYLAQQFRLCLLIDHHQTAIHELSNLKEYDRDNTNLQYLKKNIYAMINKDKAASELVIQFTEQLFGSSFKDQLPFNVYEHLIKFSKHISDWDLFQNKYPESDPLVLALYYKKLDINVNTNPNIFFQFFQLDFRECLQLGNKLRQERDHKIKNVIVRKKLMELRGIQCYGVDCNDTSLVNDLGTQLAILSAKAGLQNLGIVYREQVKFQQLEIKVYLRSDTKNTQQEFRCDLLAQQFGGGGHTGAAAFSIGKKEFKQLVIQ